MIMERNKTTNKIICRYLRAKSPFGSFEGGENEWLFMDDANTICWCIQSTGGAGPDNGLVDPQLCMAGRACFVHPEE